MAHQGHLFSSAVVLHLLAMYIYVLDARRSAYTVGDINGWTLLTNFSNWVQRKEFNVGDILEFNFKKGSHNVMIVNSTGYEQCIKDMPMGLFTTGNDSIALSKVGKIWFTCGVSDHCQNGQKLAVNVLP